MKRIKLETLRHSCSHLLATAVLALWPKVKFGIGPAIEDGFYYDFEFPQPISDKDLPKIEAKMKELKKKGLAFVKKEVSLSEAKKIFKNQPYKLQLLQEIGKVTPNQAIADFGVRSPRGKINKVSIYQLSNFIDLCRGPHVKNTSEIGSFKLLSIAGAYWKGDEKNPMLSRIYGTCFSTQKELDQYLAQQEEAKKRDHRKLSKALELFLIDEEFGQGLPLWLPKGALLRKQVMDFALETYLKEGYQLVATPHIANLNLWKRSGHWNFYRDYLYSPIKVDEEKYILKPMNCPGHVKIYQSKIRSYKDLPLRFTEMGTVYRYEKSGVLHGLTRVRGFTQDDAHIFCTPDQLHDELTGMIQLTQKIYTAFGLRNPEVSLSIRDPKEKKKYLGDDKTWKLAEKALEKALKMQKLKYVPYPGEAVFYGPKSDFHFKDSLGRKWQLTTIQVDFNFPERFDLFYIEKDGKKHRPIMLHRALLGSIERFIGILIEHYAGAFPVWLAPVQVVVIPITDRNIKYAKDVVAPLAGQEIRVELDDRRETTSAKIRDAELQKIPYMLVVGKKEEKSKTVSVRARGEKELGPMKIEDFLKKIKKEIEEKTLG